MEVVRTLVVDDSAFMRKMIANILDSDKQVEVIGTARNGQEALEKAAILKPDVITLDIEMPVMDGITVLKHLMEKNPTPVIMVSSLTKKSADMTVKALELGAVDFIAKPSGSISLDIEKVSEEIISKVITAAASNVLRSATKVKKKENDNLKKTIVAIGTSTGGPKALQHVLPFIPTDFPCPIVIVQHMPAGFTRSLAQRLDSLSSITVKEAEDGDLLKRGTAYIGPGGYQLKIIQSGKNYTCQLTNETVKSTHCPSVDVLYKSLADLDNIRVISVIMTGMGMDGTEGLKKMKQIKSDTYAITESAKTAVVYGMPQAAMKTGLVDQEEDLNNISSTLNTLLNNSKDGTRWN